jgi:hypothetical protein
VPVERPPVYGLDIETDTTIDGLDPRVAAVVTVAVSTPEGDEVLAGPERSLLLELDAVIATWNGAAFDLPFLAERAARLGFLGGLRLRVDRTLTRRYGGLPGHSGSYQGFWYGHGHIDGYRMYRADVGRVLQVSCSLKSIARLVGLTPVEVDRERIHDLPPDELAAYVASDARLARLLAERRWPGASRFVDTPWRPLAPPTGPTPPPPPTPHPETPIPA